MVIRYLRGPNRQPFGCVAVTDDGRLGWSLCNPKDHFTRQRARTIAIGRASCARARSSLTLEEADLSFSILPLAWFGPQTAGLMRVIADIYRCWLEKETKRGDVPKSKPIPVRDT